MGNSASQEQNTQRLLERGALTLPLGSQVEKLFHEDFDEDAEAILTPSTPMTPGILVNDKQQKRKSRRSSPEVTKWAPVHPVASSKRNTAHVPSLAASSGYLSPKDALSKSSSRKSLKGVTAPRVLDLQAQGADLEEQYLCTATLYPSSNTSPQTVYGPTWDTFDPGRNQVFHDRTASQSSIGHPEYITPQAAVSRIARRMASNPPTPPLAHTAATLSASTPSKHDSKLLSEDIQPQDFQPANLVPDPDHAAKSYILERLAAEGGAQNALLQASERSRSRGRERKRKKNIPRCVVESSNKSLQNVPAARWQQRITKRLSDQELSDHENKSSSRLGVKDQVTWFDDASGPGSDMED